MFEARSYQTEAVNSLYWYFENNTGNPVIAMPTGTGKSVVIALFLQSVYQKYPGQRVLILTHVKELIAQNHRKLLQLWPFAPAGIYSSGLGKRDVHSPITFAGIASIVKKWDVFGHVDLVIIDEAHLVSHSENTMYHIFLSHLKIVNPYLKVIGLTATPWRLGHGSITEPSKDKNGQMLPSIFSDICFDITGIEAFNRLIAENSLCPVIPKSTETVLDISGVHMRGGEFLASELQNAVDKQEVTVSAVEESLKLGYNRNHWLVFAAGIAHTIHTAEIMNAMGIPTVAIHFKMTDNERDYAIVRFQEGYYRAAVNNNVLTTGFDFPAIDLILCLRPTASSVLWVQMLGRGTRPYPGKNNCLVLDFANNTRRLGPINDPVIPKKKGSKGGPAPVKECPVCNSLVHASVRICNGILPDESPCTHEFTFETKLKQGASTAELIKGEIPVVEQFKIDHITFSLHHKENRPVSVKVSYYCGYSLFNEFVCLEHPGFAGHKARDWCRQHAMIDIPVTCSELLERTSELRTPTHLRVWVNKKYPEILACVFNEDVHPSVQVDKPVITPEQSYEDSYEDDIPF